MQEIFPLFHCRRPVGEGDRRGGGAHWLTFIELSGSSHTVVPPSVTPRNNNNAKNRRWHYLCIFPGRPRTPVGIPVRRRAHFPALRTEPWPGLRRMDIHERRTGTPPSECVRAVVVHASVSGCARARPRVCVRWAFMRVCMCRALKSDRRCCCAEGNALQPALCLHSDQSATLPVRAWPGWWAGLPDCLHWFKTLSWVFKKIYINKWRHTICSCGWNLKPDAERIGHFYRLIMN